MRSKLSNKGDTIIEVLLAIAVVSSVLGGAYVSSNRSLNASRQAEERVEALKLTEGQLERMKALAKDPAKNIHSAPNVFCIDTSANAKTTTVPCADSSLGVDYRFTISRDPATNIFTIITQWDRLGGGQEELKIAYKLHP